MALLLNKLQLRQFAKTCVRYGHGKDHWSRVRKRKTPKHKALEHFDEFYANVYKDKWPEIRAALLKEESKYIAIVNNFSDSERIRLDLESIGAINLKALYDVQKEEEEFYKLKSIAKPFKLRADQDYDGCELVEIKATYPSNYPHLEEAMKAKDPENEGKVPVVWDSIEEDLNEVSIDYSRIVDPSVGLSTLHEYVPATKIKGLDDWILESDYYKFYARAEGFKINVEEESVLSFPEHLHAYFFERRSYCRFPSPGKGSTGVSDYYLFDGASILPVLALDLKINDQVLDMCAAPGGKALTIVQTLLPLLVVANDNMESRVNRIERVMHEFLSDFYDLDEIFISVTQQDARTIDEKDYYNKILVDVPCTTDRHILHSDENNIFKPSRVKERLQLPEIQSDILANALKLVAPGGTVVYSTCTLSPIQNDGVVKAALKKAWDESDSVLVVKDMTEALSPLKCIYSFGDSNLKYGHIVIPTRENNWGPMYFCKIVRVQ